jgi:hypothetical protein
MGAQLMDVFLFEFLQNRPALLTHINDVVTWYMAADQCFPGFAL